MWLRGSNSSGCLSWTPNFVYKDFRIPGANAVDGSLLDTLDENDIREMGIIDTSIKLKKLFVWINVGFKEYNEFLRNQQKGASLN